MKTVSFLSKLLASLMRNYFPKRTSGAPLHALSKLYDVPVCFVFPPPSFEAVYCYICGRRRVSVARYHLSCSCVDFLFSVGPHPVLSLHIYTFVVSRAFMAGAASQAGDADSSRAPGLTYIVSKLITGFGRMPRMNCLCNCCIQDSTNFYRLVPNLLAT